MKTISITCDFCGNDLKSSSNELDYRLSLNNERVPSTGGFVTSMGAYPAIKTDAHFCGVDCLRGWLDKEFPVENAPYHGGKCWAAYQRKCRANGDKPQ